MPKVVFTKIFSKVSFEVLKPPLILIIILITYSSHNIVILFSIKMLYLEPSVNFISQ